jgi:hypothetical protein
MNKYMVSERAKDISYRIWLNAVRHGTVKPIFSLAYIEAPLKLLLLFTLLILLDN